MNAEESSATMGHNSNADSVDEVTAFTFDTFLNFK